MKAPYISKRKYIRGTTISISCINRWDTLRFQVRTKTWEVSFLPFDWCYDSQQVNDWKVWDIGPLIIKLQHSPS